jgi:hypothetical protein
MSDEILDRPAKSAAKAEHVAWAVLVHDMAEADADALTKEQLLDLPDAVAAPDDEEPGPDEPAAEAVADEPAAAAPEGPVTKLFRGEGGAVIRMALPLPEVMANQLAKGTLTEVEE